MASTPMAGNMTATITDTSGQTLTSNVLLNHTVAAVVKMDPMNYYNRLGPAQGIGFVNNDSVISTTGTVNIDSVGNLTHSFNGSYVGSNGRGTITGGSQTMTPGRPLPRPQLAL